MWTKRIREITEERREHREGATAKATQVLRLRAARFAQDDSGLVSADGFVYASGEMNPLADDLEHIAAETQGLWEEMRGQRVFLTGGTGFFGCWLVESFCHVNRTLGLGARATVLSRDPAKFAAKCPHVANDPAITLLAGDVR